VNCWATELLFTDSVAVVAEKTHLSPHRPTVVSHGLLLLPSAVGSQTLWLKVA
jgi:hypothetical protein